MYIICYGVKAKHSSRLEVLNIWLENIYRRKNFFNTISGRQPEGKCRQWTEALLEDSKKTLGIRNQKEEEMNRQVRSGHIQETKAQYQAVESQMNTKIREQTRCLFWLIDTHGRKKKDHCR